MKKYNLLVVIGVAFLSSLVSASEITAKNWLKHPSVIEIRNIYSDVRKEIDSGKLNKKFREEDSCEFYGASDRVMYSDASGIARNYSYNAGSGDSLIQWDFYYDQKGHLRFAFIQGGAVNGTVIHHRIYFDVNRKRIWENQKLVEGPGYTFPRGAWPNEDIVYDPVKHYAPESYCQ